MTDLGDLQSLHTHTHTHTTHKKNSINVSQKSVINVSDDGTCMLNLVTVTLVDFFLNRPIDVASFKYSLFDFLYSLLRLVSLKKP